jgi:hypothetical protein
MDGYIISGQYAGGYITQKSTPILKDIKAVEFIESVNDPFTDFNGIQRFAQKYIVRVTYYSGAESVVKATPDLLPYLEAYTKENARWRSLTPEQQQREIELSKKSDEEAFKFGFKLVTIIWAIIAVFITLCLIFSLDKIPWALVFLILLMCILGWFISLLFC